MDGSTNPDQDGWLTRSYRPGYTGWVPVAPNVEIKRDARGFSTLVRTRPVQPRSAGIRFLGRQIWHYFTDNDVISKSRNDFLQIQLNVCGQYHKLPRLAMNALIFFRRHLDSRKAGPIVALAPERDDIMERSLPQCSGYHDHIQLLFVYDLGIELV
jgi:hypothetical protein